MLPALGPQQNFQTTYQTFGGSRAPQINQLNQLTGATPFGQPNIPDIANTTAPGSIGGLDPGVQNMIKALKGGT